ncbi:hypothetical protein, partial [Faecalibaculum rodentium]|uniref:hypothetical protein n=1 Tax=Faecalibaculum rodentium TaxID=1702221 RepID=UPI00258B0F1F
SAFQADYVSSILITCSIQPYRHDIRRGFFVPYYDTGQIILAGDGCVSQTGPGRKPASPSSTHRR